MPGVVRAIDVGFGQTKFTTGLAGQEVMCDQFPSIALPSLFDPTKRGSLGGKRRTTCTWVNGLCYEVGPDIELAGSAPRADMSLEQYVDAPEHLALMRGALYFMPQIDHVDLLVVGLPVSVFLRRKAQLERLAVGEHEVGGRKITVSRALAIAQPQGALVSFAAQEKKSDVIKREESLVIDIGMRTVDWLTARGWRLISTRSHSAPNGVGTILSAIADVIANDIGEGYEDRAAIDLALRKSRSLSVYGRTLSMDRFKPLIEAHTREALRALTHSVGPTYALDNIVLVGGGAYLFRRAVKEAFPRQRFQELQDPQFANVRGYQRAGMDKLGLSSPTRAEPAEARDE